MISPDPKIPTDWRDVLLGNNDFAATKSGGTPSRSNAESFDGGIPWLKSGELNDNDIWHTEESVSEKALQVSSLRILPANTVLIAMYGATAGKTGLLRVPSTINQAICSIQPVGDSFSPRFLQYFLIKERPALLRRRYGGAQPNLNQGIIKQIQVLLPPLPEQKKIAAVLLKIQRAIEMQEKIIQALRGLKKSAMQHLFTHGLRGEKTKTTEIGEIPESWGVKKIDEILDESLYGLSMRGQTSGSYPILRMNCQIDGGVVFDDLQYVDLDPKTFEKFRLVDGDLLFNRTNSHDLVGRMAVFHATREVVFASYLIRLRLDRKSTNPDFVNYYFNTNVTQTRVRTLASRGVSQSNISASKLKTFEVPLPSDLDEQADVVRNLKAIDSKIRLHEFKKTALQGLFKTTLNKLMTGEIRVADLDIDVSEVEV